MAPMVMINHHLRWVPWWQVEVPFHVSADLSVSVSFMRMSSESPMPTWRWILMCVMRHYIAPRPLELSLHALQHGTHCCFTFGFHDLGILATTTNSIRSRRRGPYGRCWIPWASRNPWRLAAHPTGRCLLLTGTWVWSGIMENADMNSVFVNFLSL